MENDPQDEKRRDSLPGMSFNAPVTFNAPMFDIHDNQNVYFNTTPEREKAVDEVPRLLTALLEAVDEEGGRIFTEKGQWYAVYRVLSECMDYPKEMRTFCRLMARMGMDRATPSISYESIKKIPQTVHLPSGKVSLWSVCLDRADEKARKQIIVAAWLIEKLDIYK